MENRGLQGWAADPFRLHEARYFSGGRPTKLVRDGRVESYDEPPSDTYVPADAATGSDGLRRAPAAAPVNFARPATQHVGPAPATRPVRYAREATQHVGPAPATPPVRYAREATQHAGVTGPRARSLRFESGPSRRPRGPLFAAATGIVAVVVIASLILVHRSAATTNQSQTTTNQNQAPTLSSAAFVTQSAHRTLAERTADMTMSGTIKVAGDSFSVSGTGQADLSTNAMALDVHFTTSDGTLEEKEILVDGNLFFAPDINGTNMAQLTGGRSWIQMPFQQSASANLAGSDPVSSLSVLEQQGSKVQVLPSQVIDGVNCTGYAVTPSAQEMTGAAKQESAELGVSSATTDQELQLIKGMSPPTISLWIDGQGLVREMSMKLQLNVQGTGDSASFAMDFSHYGAPVTITAPTPSDTISYSSFLQKLSSVSVS